MPETRVLLNSFAVLYYDVLSAVRSKGHKLVICDELQAAYRQDVERYVPQFRNALAVALGEFDDATFVVRRKSCRTRELSSLHDLPPHHQEYLQWAIGERVRFFVTERQEWLALSQRFNHEFHLQIVTPGQYMRDP